MQVRSSAWWQPPRLPSYEQTQRAKILYFLLLAALLGSLALGLENLVFGWYREAWILFLLGGACLLGFYLNQTLHYFAAAVILTFLLASGIGALLYYGAGLYDSGILGYPFIIICAAFLFRRWRGLLLATVLSVGSILGLYLLEIFGVFDPTYPVSLLRAIVLSLLLTLIAAAIWAIRESWQANLLHLRESYDQTLEGWAHLLDSRDGETAGHSRRVAELCICLARRLKCTREQIRNIQRGAYLHDIGKMSIPDRILQKPGPLDSKEWEIMKQHPVLARDFINQIPFLRPAIDIPYCHHERWDGSGYPEGLKGEQIPIAARIFTIIDHWDALLSDRPYRKAWPREMVLEYLQENSGKIFDPRVSDAFLGLIREGKVGI